MNEAELKELIRTDIGANLIADRLFRRPIALLRGVLDSIKIGHFVLSSGATSNFYFDARQVTLDPELMILVAQQILLTKNCVGLKVTAIGGPATAAIPMSTAAACLKWTTLHEVDKDFRKTFYVRVKAKDHGTKSLIEGLRPNSNDVVLLGDDVLTSGKSLRQAAEVLRDECGVEVEHAFVLVDRQEGGRELLEANGIRTHATFFKSDLMFVKDLMAKSGIGAKS